MPNRLTVLPKVSKRAILSTSQQQKILGIHYIKNSWYRFVLTVRKIQRLHFREFQVAIWGTEEDVPLTF
jgi:hypothetical protein